MPSNKLKYRSFDHNVRDICAYLGDDDATKDYVRVARFLRMAIQDMDMTVIHDDIKTIFLEVEDNLTVNLPNDFIQVSKIGVCCNGRIRPIGVDEKICKLKPEDIINCCSCGDGESQRTAVDQQQESCPKCTFHNVQGFHNSYFYSDFGVGFHYGFDYLYGAKGNMFPNGTYRLDEENNRLLMGRGCDVQPGSEIVLEYKGARTSEGFNLIDARLSRTLMHYTAYIYYGTKNPGLSEKEYRAFKRQYQTYKRIVQNYSLEEIAAAITGTYHSSIKR